MIGSMMMMGSSQGPASAWSYVGSSSTLATAIVGAGVVFPSGVQAGDLLVAVVSAVSEEPVKMADTADWTKLVGGTQDVLAWARYRPGMPIPQWTKPGAGVTIFATVLAFRANGWDLVKLESNKSPPEDVVVTTQYPNQLVLNLATTRTTPGAWDNRMPNIGAASRISRDTAPGQRVFSTTVASPTVSNGVRLSASVATRNFILSAY